MWITFNEKDIAWSSSLCNYLPSYLTLFFFNLILTKLGNYDVFRKLQHESQRIKKEAKMCPNLHVASNDNIELGVIVWDFYISQRHSLFKYSGMLRRVEW